MTNEPNSIVGIQGHTYRLNGDDGLPVRRVSRYTGGPVGPGWYHRVGLELRWVGAVESDAVNWISREAAIHVASVAMSEEDVTP